MWGLEKLTDDDIRYLVAAFPHFMAGAHEKYPGSPDYALMSLACGKTKHIFEKWLDDTHRQNKLWFSAGGALEALTFDWPKQSWIATFAYGPPIALHRKLKPGAWHPHEAFPEADHAAHLSAELGFDDDAFGRCCGGVCGRCGSGGGCTPRAWRRHRGRVF